MTNDEAKAAWRTQAPVILDGITYTVQSLVYKYPNTLLLELLDKNKNCIVVAQPERTALKENLKEGKNV